MKNDSDKYVVGTTNSPAFFGNLDSFLVPNVSIRDAFLVSGRLPDCRHKFDNCFCKRCVASVAGLQLADIDFCPSLLIKVRKFGIWLSHDLFFAIQLFFPLYIQITYRTLRFYEDCHGKYFFRIRNGLLLRK